MNDFSNIGIEGKELIGKFNQVFTFTIEKLFEEIPFWFDRIYMLNIQHSIKEKAVKYAPISIESILGFITS